MDHRRAYELLRELERRVDVNSYWIDGVQVWPLVRQQLWMHLLRSPASIQSPRALSTEPPRKQPEAKPAAHRARDPRDAVDLGAVRSQLARADILFFSRKEDHTELFAEGAVDRIVDPLIWLARDRGFSCIKVSPGEGGAQEAGQLERSVTLAADDAAAQKDAAGVAALARFQRAASIAEAEGLLSKVEAVIGRSPVGNGVILSLVTRLNQRADYYEAVLDVVRPRLVMLGVYYSAHAAAMIHACRRRKIPVVDVQHGKQGLYHAMYGGWPAMPPEGYSTLPDLFWTWGKESADTIDTGMPHGRQRPLTVVGGNRWLATWRKGSPLRCQPEVDALFSRMEASKRRILISLQPIPNPIPPHVLSLMRNSPADWLWLVRTHPHQRPQISEIAGQLAQAGVASFDVEAASVAPLYPLLSRIDAHVTCWSSVAFEAPLFGKLSILVHPTALELYARQIEDGRFHYADNEAPLRRLLEQAPGARQPELLDSYIETDDELAIRALKRCLSFKVRKPTLGLVNRARLMLRRTGLLMFGWAGGQF